jgi:biotin carboxyl carrier protein
MRVTVQVDGRTFEVEVADGGARPIVATVEGERFEVWPEETAVRPASTGQETRPSAAPVPAGTPASQPPRPSRRTSGEAAAAANKVGLIVYAPLPGVVDSVAVQVGDTVTAGQALCVLEAMKMKNIIRALRVGQIARVHVVIGQHVKHNDPMVEFVE